MNQGQMNFDDFFEAATGHVPYDFQRRLAVTALPGSCESRLIQVPTGLGKTAAVVLAWLWNRVGPPSVSSQPPTPRRRWPNRLVYCLPIRALLEQTEREVAKWLANLTAEAPTLGITGTALTELNWLALHSPILLMRGEELEQAKWDWDLHPECPYILIGTQDILLSRALNRAYGISCYRWPIQFGLLNNDCLWVHDETQLMGVGLETSVQMAGFRDRFGAQIPSFHWWMSASLDANRMATPEAPPLPELLELSPQEQLLPAMRQRVVAVKRLRRAATALTPDASVYAGSLAEEILRTHVHGTLTLVIVNTVERAQETFQVLRRGNSCIPATLLHSRFRPVERQELVQRVLESAGDHIVVSTQVVEAGADLSARTLFTELAPWSSLVQRFGRCHRCGEFAESGADIWWVDVAHEAASPYDAGELSSARNLLAGQFDASLATLRRIKPPAVEEPARDIIRPRDLRELFDTTADLAGADLDISRFILESDETDCSIFWREARPGANAGGPTHDELCPVTVSQLRPFAEKHLKTKVWTWAALGREWVHPHRLVPGHTYCLATSLGGYDRELGFDRRCKTAITSPGAGTRQESYDDEWGTTTGHPELLDAHTTAVLDAVQTLATSLGMSLAHTAALRCAALWHDVGKAHPAFQEALRKTNPALAVDQLWVKSGSKVRLDFCTRTHFRHELASALAFRALAALSTPENELVCYLIAAHHGKVRLSLRALPGENEPPSDSDHGEPLFARGLWEGDRLPPLVWAGQAWPGVTLYLSSMQIGVGPDGQPSWLESCLALRDAPELGPFRLAFLEALLRAADMRASAEGHQR